MKKLALMLVPAALVGIVTTMLVIAPDPPSLVYASAYQTATPTRVLNDSQGNTNPNNALAILARGWQLENGQVPDGVKSGGEDGGFYTKTDPNSIQKPSFLWNERGMSVALVAGTPKAILCIRVATATTRTVQIREISFRLQSCLATPTGAAGLLKFDLVSMAGATGVPTSTVSPCPALSLNQTSTPAAIYSNMIGLPATGVTIGVPLITTASCMEMIFAHNTVWSNITTAVQGDLATVPFIPFYKWDPASGAEPLILRKNTADGLILQMEESAAATTTFVISTRVLWTEE